MKEKKESKKNELVNEKRMLNFKMCSLMKKQFFTLMMTFALIMGLSVSVFAQTDPPASPGEGSPGNPKIYITGATDSVSINRGVSDSEVSWILYKGTNNTAPQVTGTDLDLVAHPTGWGATQTSATGNAGAPTYFHFKWTDTAAGQYYLEVTETDQRNAAEGTPRTCAATVRGYHIYILGFDAAIYASNAAGDSIDAALREGCGGPTYPAFMNDVVMNVDGTRREVDILNTTTDPATAGTDLHPIIGTHANRALRYYTVQLTFDGAPTGANYTSPTVASVKMDIVINVPTVNSQDSLYVASINDIGSENMQGDNASYMGATVNLTEATEPTTYKYTFPVEFNDSWEYDLLPTASVRNITLFGGADGSGLNLGEEPEDYEDLVPEPGGYRDNTSNAFTIFGKPATGPITD